MASKTVVTLIDDIDETPADITALFSVNSVDYEIDLSSNNYREFQKAMIPFIQYARKVPATKRRNGRAIRAPKMPEAHTRQGRIRSQEVREWAKSNGIPVRDRGRIPAHIVEQYRTRIDPPNGEVKPGKQPGKGGKIARKRR